MFDLILNFYLLIVAVQVDPELTSKLNPKYKYFYTSAAQVGSILKNSGF